MTDQPPKYSAQQLQAYEVLQRIRMAWVALWFILILLAIGVVSFLVSLFLVQSQSTAKVLLGGVDTLLGLSVRTIIAYLFPSPKKPAKS
jgi:hypothetical protein